MTARVVGPRALAHAELPPGFPGFLRKPLYLLDLLYQFARLVSIVRTGEASWLPARVGCRFREARSWTWLSGGPDGGHPLRITNLGAAQCGWCHGLLLGTLGSGFSMALRGFTCAGGARRAKGLCLLASLPWQGVCVQAGVLFDPCLGGTRGRPEGASR